MLQAKLKDEQLITDGDGLNRKLRDDVVFILDLNG